MITNLTIYEKNGSLWADSRKVAAMIEKRHDHLVRDIRGYIEAMVKSTAPKIGVSATELKIEPSEFFLETSYKDPTGRTLPCYDLSKKGCEFVANKLTGDKGVLFTAAYVNQFNAYEEFLKNAKELPQKPRHAYYPTKATSAGEVASLVKVNRLIMKDQGSNPNKIARQTEKFYKQFGVDTIDHYVEPTFPEQLALTQTITTQIETKVQQLPENAG